MAGRYPGPVGKEFSGDRARAMELEGRARVLVQQCIDQIDRLQGGVGVLTRTERLTDGSVITAYVNKYGAVPLVRTYVTRPNPENPKEEEPLFYDEVAALHLWFSEVNAVCELKIATNGALSTETRVVRDDGKDNVIVRAARILYEMWDIVIQPALLPLTEDYLRSWAYTIPHRDPVTKLASAYVRSYPGYITLGGLRLVTDLGDQKTRYAAAVYGDSLFVISIAKERAGEQVPGVVYRVPLRVCPISGSELINYPSVQIPTLDNGVDSAQFIQWHPTEVKFLFYSTKVTDGPSTTTYMWELEGEDYKPRFSYIPYRDIAGTLTVFSLYMNDGVLYIEPQGSFTSSERIDTWLVEVTTTGTYFVQETSVVSSHATETATHIAFGMFDRNGDLSVFGCKSHLSLSCTQPATKVYDICGTHISREVYEEVFNRDYQAGKYTYSDSLVYSTLSGPLKSKNRGHSTKTISFTMTPSDAIHWPPFSYASNPLGAVLYVGSSYYTKDILATGITVEHDSPGTPTKFETRPYFYKTPNPNERYYYFSSEGSATGLFSIFAEFIETGYERTHYTMDRYVPYDMVEDDSAFPLISRPSDNPSFVNCVSRFPWLPSIPINRFADRIVCGSEDELVVVPDIALGVIYKGVWDEENERMRSTVISAASETPIPQLDARGVRGVLFI